MIKNENMKRALFIGTLLMGLNGFGQESTETALGVAPAKEEWDLRAFPNPTSDLLIVKSSKEIKYIEFFDLNGRELKLSPLPNHCYSLADLPAGWVFMLVESTDGSVEKKNIYKQ